MRVAGDPHRDGQRVKSPPPEERGARNARSRRASEMGSNEFHQIPHDNDLFYCTIICLAICNIYTLRNICFVKVLMHTLHEACRYNPRTYICTEQRPRGKERVSN